MTTIREFDHDGSKFEITKNQNGKNWDYRVLCDGNHVGGISTASKEVVSDGRFLGVNIDAAVADELERAVKVVHDLKIIPYRPQ